MAWDRVLVLHQTKYGNRQRTVQSLQRKFASLYNHKMPTGDPRCPETVRKAKQLYKAISEKMDVATGEAEGDDEDEEDDDEDFLGSSGGEDDEGIDEGDGEGGGYESGLEEPVPEGQNMNIDGGGAITTSGNGDGNDVRNCDGNEGNDRIPGNNTGVDNIPGSRPSSRATSTGDGPSQTAGSIRTRQRTTSDKNLPATKVARTSAVSTPKAKTSAFTVPIVHSRREKRSSPGTATSSMFQDMMQMMMVQREMDSEAERRRQLADERRREVERIQREADERRREAEELRHRQMMEMIMMSMMANTQRSQAQYYAPPPLNNYGQGMSNMPQSSFEQMTNNFSGYVPHTFNDVDVGHATNPLPAAGHAMNPLPVGGTLSGDGNKMAMVAEVEEPAGEGRGIVDEPDQI
jgi:hypothetical protein